MPVAFTASKLVSLLLISLLAITRSTDRNDSIPPSVNSVVANLNSGGKTSISNDTAIEEPVVIKNKLLKLVPQRDNSTWGLATRCYDQVYEENKQHLTNFYSVYPYLTILIVAMSLFYGPYLFIWFFFLKQTIPTFLCMVAPVSNLIIFLKFSY